MKGVECIQSLTNFQIFPQKNIVKMKGVLNVNKISRIFSVFDVGKNCNFEFLGEKIVKMK